MNDIDDLLKESRKLQEDFNKTNPTWTNTKSILIAALVVAIALIILIGSVVIIPTILVVVIIYLLFLVIRQAIS